MTDDAPHGTPDASDADRLDAILARQDEIEARQDRMEARQDEMEARQDRMEARQDEIEAQVNEIDAQTDALNRARLYVRDRVDDLEDDLDDLTADMAELTLVVEPDEGRTEYDQLTFDQKVGRVRRTLAERAGASNGKAAMNYREVMMLFDGHPSASHCYNLMKRAAVLDGFGYGDARGDGQKRIRLKMDGLNDTALIYHAKNATSDGTA